jgi:hypothetical protein
MSRIPKFIRRFFFDSIEGALIAIFALSFAIPNTLDEAKSTALIIGAAVIRASIAAVVAGAAKNLPAFLVWLGGKFEINAPDA